MTVKMYLENPYLKELKGTVIAKEKKGDKYHIILNRTIFYPRHSEAINVDIGTINGVEIVDVFKQKDDIIHVTRKDINSKDVTLKIDWNTRFNYMQQHTGSHILSAAINKLCGVEILGFRFEREYSYIDTGLKRLTDMDIERIEKLANNIACSNFKIKRESPEIVSIDNVNTVACEGIHCSSTGEVGLIKIIEDKKNKDENIDITFVCGFRALSEYGLAIELINKISQILSTEKINILGELDNILKESKASIENEV